jgi:uncharacterized 2Fe-2S/4Fe-4S cluster protein (DUF4445 family)
MAEHVLMARPGKKLLDVLRENALPIQSVCGGTGSCGKCTVRFTDGIPQITGADRKKLSQQLLEEGNRLSCMVLLQKDCTIELNSLQEEEIQVPEIAATGMMREQPSEARYAIGIDIGTTTLAAALIRTDQMQDAEDELSGPGISRIRGRILAAETGTNHQRRYGSDVISRIQAAQNGAAEELQESITKDLAQLIGRLLQKTKIAARKIERIAIAGNTTMLHLLRGYSCAGLGTYPYRAVTLAAEEHKAPELFPELTAEWKNCSVTIFPGISAFVGADVLSGIYALDLMKKPAGAGFLFLDLGTNGEMAAGNGRGISVTSTAAGPVFEGGGISCGMGSIPGAICHVTITGGRCEYRTIGDQPPVGVCGTGVMETAAALHRAGITDDTGLMKSPYFENGYVLAQEGRNPIIFTQQDVRQVQLGKAAVRAGTEILLQESGLNPEQIAHVYIAGGFGYRIDFAAIRELGILPYALLAKTEAVGNTSLYGTLKYLVRCAQCGEASVQELMQLCSAAHETALAQQDAFDEQYYAHMNFESEAAHEL